MAEMMDQLLPIADLLGPSSVKADYSQTQIAHRGNRGLEYRPGWRVEINGAYKGAVVRLTRKAPTLDQAAAEALQELRHALGLD
jgi:hypothetical protein